MSEKKVKIDLIVIGNPNSGKTSLIRRYIDGEASFSHFYNPTLGLNLEKKVVKVKDTLVTVCIWDTAGQEKFFSLTKNYFKKADGVLIIFDLTDNTSYDRVSNFWIHEVKEKSEEGCAQVLIGNKSDLAEERVIDKIQAQSLANELGLNYFETSARTGENVDQCLDHLVKECLLRVKDTEPRTDDFELEGKQKPKKVQSCFSSSKRWVAKMMGAEQK